jgi:hypothetical protein
VVVRGQEPAGPSTSETVQEVGRTMVSLSSPRQSPRPPYAAASLEPTGQQICIPGLPSPTPADDYRQRRRKPVRSLKPSGCVAQSENGEKSQPDKPKQSSRRTGNLASFAGNLVCGAQVC